VILKWISLLKSVNSADTYTVCKSGCLAGGFNPKSEVETGLKSVFRGSIRLWRVVFGVTLKTLSHKLFPSGNCRKLVRRKFGIVTVHGGVQFQNAGCL
jgi:hypothetical protein